MKPDETGMIEELLKQRAQAAVTGAAVGGPLCGDPELIAAYAENSLDEDGRASFQIHLASCAACREAVAALVRMAPREVLAEAPAHAVSWWKQWLWIPALAGLLIAGSVLLMNRDRVQEEPRRIAQLDNRLESEKKAPPVQEPLTVAPASPAAVGKKIGKKKAAINRDAPVAKPADILESGGGGGSRPTVLQDQKLVADEPAIRKQEELQIAPAASGGQVQNQNLTSQAQNAPPPAPFVNNLQNGMNAQNMVDASSTLQSADKTRMLRTVPQAAKAPPPAPVASPSGASAAGALVLLGKEKAVLPAKGRIEKGKLQLSTDGGGQHGLFLAQ